VQFQSPARAQRRPQRTGRLPTQELKAQQIDECQSPINVIMQGK